MSRADWKVLAHLKEFYWLQEISQLRPNMNSIRSSASLWQLSADIFHTKSPKALNQCSEDSYVR